MIHYWGPRIWYLLHLISYTYPDFPEEKDKILYNNFFSNVLPELLPCDYCKKHFKNYLIEKPVKNNLENKNSLIEWVVKSHNVVNKRHNKKIYTINESHYLYLHKPINHSMLYSLLKYYSDLSRRQPNNLIKLKEFLKYFIIFFPCISCRNKLYYYFSNTPNLKILYEKINNIYRLGMECL